MDKKELKRQYAKEWYKRPEVQKKKKERFLKLKAEGYFKTDEYKEKNKIASKRKYWARKEKLNGQKEKIKV